MKRQCFYLAGIALLTLCAGSAQAASKNLMTYDQLLQAVQQGDDVRAIINFDKCTLKKAEGKSVADTSVDTSGTSSRINFTIFSHYKVPVNNQEKFTIATSQTILTEHRVFGPVYAYGRLRVFEDNTGEFHSAYYDPKTYELKGAANYICRLGNGVDQGGIELFASA